MTGKDEPSEKVAESELSMLVITADNNKKEKKDSFALSSALAELVVDINMDKQISVDGEGSNRKR